MSASRGTHSPTRVAAWSTLLGTLPTKPSNCVILRSLSRLDRRWVAEEPDLSALFYQDRSVSADRRRPCRVLCVVPCIRLSNFMSAHLQYQYFSSSHFSSCFSSMGLGRALRHRGEYLGPLLGSSQINCVMQAARQLAAVGTCSSASSSHHELRFSSSTRGTVRRELWEW